MWSSIWGATGRGWPQSALDAEACLHFVVDWCNQPEECHSFSQCRAEGRHPGNSIGVFLLLGIVKKNGILQVDYTNRLRSEGMPLRQALIEANRVRLRPILMTTFSIVAGLIPVAIGLGAGSEQRAAIAVTIIGGQTLCLILTLLVVPVAYSYLAHLTAISWSEYTALFWGRLRMQFARRFGLF